MDHNLIYLFPSKALFKKPLALFPNIAQLAFLTVLLAPIPNTYAGDFSLLIEKGTLKSDFFSKGSSTAMRFESSFHVTGGLLVPSDVLLLGGALRIGQSSWQSNSITRKGTFWGLPLMARYRNISRTGKLFLTVFYQPLSEYLTVSNSEIIVNEKKVSSSSLVTYESDFMGMEIGGSVTLGTSAISSIRYHVDFVFAAAFYRGSLKIKSVNAATSLDNVKEKIGKSSYLNEDVYLLGFSIMQEFKKSSSKE